MNEIDPREFGQLQARVEALQLSEQRTSDALALIGEKLDSIGQQLAEARGGWKTLLLVGGAAGALGSGLTKAAFWLAQVAPK